MTPYLTLLLLLIQNDDLVRHRNLGKAYYEQGEYALAVEELARVLDSGDARARDYFNAGMAYLQNAEQDRALAALTTARQMDPEMVEVDFGLGVLYKRQLRYPLARDAFSKVVARDPDDPCTWFNLGAVNASMDQIDEAEAAFARVLAMGYPRAQNFYVSALFRQATILARRGDEEAARGLFDEFQALRDETPNVALTPTALENGRWGDIETPIAVDPPADATPAAIALERRFALPAAESGCEGEPSLVLGDVDGDDDADILRTSPCGGSALYRNDGGGELTDVTDRFGLRDLGAAAGGAFADLDNDGLPSLYVWSDTESRLFLNRGGRFELARTGLPADVGTALFFDVDNDGRVDLFASRLGGGLGLYRNLDEGRFDEIWSEPSVEARGAAAVDLDANGFMDVVVVDGSGGALVLSNEGGALEPARMSLGLAGSSRARVAVVDLDHDGWLDVVATDETGASALHNSGGELVSLAALGGWVSLVPLELDGDGYQSLLGRDARGRRSLVSYRGRGRFSTQPIDLAPDVSDVIVSVDSHFVTTGDGVMRVLARSGTASPSWLGIALEGTRTNRQALGAVVEIKAGSFYQKHPYPGHPMTVFLGQRERVDVVRITWANGVIQNVIDVTTGQKLSITEAEQQTSSCPFLYLWDGERFRFLTDVVGRAPLGEILPGGGVVEPNPEDYVRIPPGTLVARDGRYVLQLTEELRELAAIDAVELVAVDHPDDVDVYANERFAAPPFEPFRFFAVGATRAPVSAVDHQGRDVLELVSHADGRDPPIAGHRIAGFAEEHALVLEAPAEGGWLFLSGWVYWPSSSSMKALDAHPSMTARPPALQVKDEHGGWVTLLHDLGLPSGIGRTLVADLTGKLLPGHRRVRIVSNFAVHWDRAFFGTPYRGSSLLTHTLAPVVSDLHYRGFSVVSLESRDRRERYDYERLQSEAPWNAVPGRYTRYGDVMPLVTERDGALVVMAPGDELTLLFDAGALPPRPEGTSRTLFLHVTGWAKDQDPNTLFSSTVGPLPSEDLRDRDREVPALVTPLAPPRSLPE